MALKYTFSFAPDPAGLLSGEIHVSSWQGSPQGVEISDISLDYSRKAAHELIISSNVSVSVLQTAIGQFSELVDEPPFSVMLVLYEGASIRWRGYLQADTLECSISMADMMELPFTCGINLLKNLDFYKQGESWRPLSWWLEKAVEAMGEAEYIFCSSYVDALFSGAYSPHARALTELIHQWQLDLFSWHDILYGICATYGLTCTRMRGRIMFMDAGTHEDSVSASIYSAGTWTATDMPMVSVVGLPAQEAVGELRLVGTQKLSTKRIVRSVGVLYDAPSPTMWMTYRIAPARETWSYGARPAFTTADKGQWVGVTETWEEQYEGVYDEIFPDIQYEFSADGTITAIGGESPYAQSAGAVYRAMIPMARDSEIHVFGTWRISKKSALQNPAFHGSVKMAVRIVDVSDVSRSVYVSADSKVYSAAPIYDTFTVNYSETGYSVDLDMKFVPEELEVSGAVSGWDPWAIGNTWMEVVLCLPYAEAYPANFANFNHRIEGMGINIDTGREPWAGVTFERDNPWGEDGIELQAWGREAELVSEEGALFVCTDGQAEYYGLHDAGMQGASSLKHWDGTIWQSSDTRARVLASSMLADADLSRKLVDISVQGGWRLHPYSIIQWQGARYAVLSLRRQPTTTNITMYAI